jgi:hypothetical protein
LSEIENKTDQLSEEQVWSMLEFSQSLNGGGIYSNILTPMLINARMKDMNLSPLQASENELNLAMTDPKNSEIVLQSFSQDLEDRSAFYHRLLDYMGDMLAFDMSYECITKGVKYKDKSYQKELDIVKSFIDRFDYKNEFGIVMREMYRNEAFFGCVRLDDEQITIQEMPASPTYTMITGRSAYTLLYSMSMYFFLQPGVDINMFPPFFRKKYLELWGDKKGNLPFYNPSMNINDRGDSSWVYWQDLSVGKDPYAWCFKLQPFLATRIPPFASLFLDIIQQPLMRSLQKNINMAAATKLVMGEVPYNKDTQAKTRDQFMISPGNLGNFLAFVKAAIGDALKTVALPLSNIQGLEFQPENELYSSYLRNTIAQSGINANLIYTNQNRTNNIEAQLSIGVDEQKLIKVYPQFEKFLNFHINRLTTNYKFKFHFEGTNNFTNRNERFDKLMALADKGIVLPNKIAGAIGMDPFDFQRELDEARETGWVDKLTPILSSFQMSGSTDTSKPNGRPQKKDSELSDEGDNTRSTAANVGRGGKI